MEHKVIRATGRAKGAAVIAVLVLGLLGCPPRQTDGLGGHGSAPQALDGGLGGQGGAP